MGKNRKSLVSLVGVEQADGAQTMTLDTYADFYTVTCVPADSSTTGTLTFDFKPIDEAGWESLIDISTNLQMTIDLADGEAKTFTFNAYMSYIRVTPTTVSDTYSIYIQQGKI